MKDENKLFYVTLATDGAKVELLFNAAGQMLAKKDDKLNKAQKKLVFV